MNAAKRHGHWENVYASKAETEVSWYQEYPTPSLELIAATGVAPSSAIVDVGGGTSHLVDALLEKGFQDITVLDLSEAALLRSKARLGTRAHYAHWVVADVTMWQPPRSYDIWHDRAAFHFLNEERDRTAYVTCLAKALKPHGHAIMATFAPDGPERCSGLPVVRYDADSLAQILGDGFELIETPRHAHRTPSGMEQRFQFSLFRRRA